MTTTPDLSDTETKLVSSGEASATVLADISRMLREVLGEYGMDDAEIDMDTKFHEDLEMESIDLVALSGQLEQHYGDRVNFAEFIADLELDEIIELTVGRLVDYVVTCLASTGGQ